MFAKASWSMSRYRAKKLSEWFEGLDQTHRSNTVVIIVDQIGQEDDEHRLRAIINNDIQIVQNTDDLDIWNKWEGDKGNIYIINRCGVPIKKLDVFGDAMNTWFEKAYFNHNQEKESEEACRCDIGYETSS